MILNFYVENFKSIRNKINLSFEPKKTESTEADEYYVSTIEKTNILKVAFILGPNASGKTNILEALAFLQWITTVPVSDKSSELDFLKPFVLDKDKNTVFLIEFVNDKKYLYEVELNKKCIVKESLYTFSPKKSLIFERTTDEEKEISKIKFGSKIKISSTDKNALIKNTLWNNTVIASFLKINIKFEALKPVLDWFKESLIIISPWKLFIPSKLLPLEFRNLMFRLMPPVSNATNEIFKLDSISKNILDGKIHKEKLIELLTRADFSVSNVEIEKIEQKDQKTQEIENKDYDKISTYFNTIIQHSYEEDFILPLYEESSGTQRYYILAGILLNALFDDKNKTKIIVIDEIEKSLHPDLVEHFILNFLKICKKHNFQLIATTHNRELLINKDIIRRNDIIWLTEKKADGSTDLFSISDFNGVRKENSLYNFYKIGKFGAVPNLRDLLDEDNEQ